MGTVKKVGKDAAVYADKVVDELDHRYNQARPAITPSVKASFSRETILQRESADVPAELVRVSQLAQQNAYPYCAVTEVDLKSQNERFSTRSSLNNPRVSSTNLTSTIVLN
jgi:hypothetical protein